MAALTKPLQSGGVPAPAVGSGVSQAVEKLWGKNKGDFIIFWEPDRLHFGAVLSFFGRREQQLSQLSSGTWDHGFPSVLGYPSARQMGSTAGAASCSSPPCCPPLHSPAHRVAGLDLVSMAISGSFCQQRRVDKPLQSGGLVPAPAVGSGVSKAVEKLWGRGREITCNFWEQDRLHFGVDLSFFGAHEHPLF